MASQKPVEKIVEGIKTFNGENWPTWSYQVKTVLKGNGLWKSIDPGEPPAEDATPEVKDAWELKSDRAYAIVALSCDLSIQADSEFKKQVTPKDLFEHIRSEYASNTINARLRIKRELRTAALTQQQGGAQGTTPQQQGSRQQPRGNRPGGRHWSGPFPGNCNICRTPGHKMRDCPFSRQFEAFRETLNTATPQDRAAAARGVDGASSAPDPPPGIPDFDFVFTVGSVSERSKRGGAEFRRNSAGVGAVQASVRAQVWEPQTPPPSVRVHVVSGTSPSAPPLSASAVRRTSSGGGKSAEFCGTEARRTRNSAESAEVTPFLTSDLFILDTASSRHIVADRAQLSHYHDASPGTGIECANGELMAVHGYGDLAAISEQGFLFKLKDVAHCPKAIGNLIGGKRITQAGNRITFENESASVVNVQTGELTMRATIVGGNWVVPLSHHTDTVALLKSSKESDPKAFDWHCRLAHVGIKSLRALGASGVIPGMPKTFGEIGFCSSCAQGKATRDHHQRIDPDDRAARPLQRVHADVFGPVRLQSGAALGGAGFGLLIVDDFTHHVWVKMMKFKSEVPTLLKAFHAGMSTQFPRSPISFVRTDGALEFKTADLYEYWLKHGVKHEVSPRYSPQSNGVAERNIRTISEMTRTMLIAAKLPLFFWRAAAEAAARIKNRVPAAGLEHGKTPFEALQGKPAKHDAYITFGCKAWGKTPEVQRTGKFDSKAQAFIYLGQVYKGGYRLWDPRLKKEVIEHSVRFEEDGMGVDLLRAEDETVSPVAATEGATPAPTLTAPQPPQREQVPGPPSQLVQLARNALDHNAVPPQARGTLQTIVRGGTVPIEERSAAAAALMEFSKQMEAEAREQQTRGQEQSRERAQPASAPAAEGAGVRGSSDTNERRSARLAGAAPTHEPLPPTHRKREEPGDGETCFAVLEPDEVPYENPRTVREALDGPDREYWLEAMHIEVKSHINRGTWRVVKRFGKANLISAKWVFVRKVNADGSIQKYKARLVARGFTQVQAGLDMEMHQIDFETAYLNAPLKNEIFVVPPDGLDELGIDLLPDDALELLLALYGLKQSGHEWHLVLREALKTLGFEQCKFDPTMFVRSGKRPAMLLVYVDDILVAAPHGGDIEAVKAELLNLFKGTDLGPAHHILGIRISRDREEGSVTLDQERFAKEALKRFGLDDCKPVKTPMEAKVCLRNAVEGEPRADKEKYQAMVGSMAYLAQGTRADLAYIVSLLGRFSSDPTEAHMAAAKRVLRYIQGTIGAKLVFGGKGKGGGVDIEGYVDSDWAADRDDRRSTSGFVFTVNGGAVSWGSRKQGAVALSTAEAEYIAAGVAGREALMLKGALVAAGHQLGAVHVHCDNQAAIQLVKNPGSHHDRSKHIDIVHHWIRDKVQEGAFAFDYIPTDLNPADAFTKPLGQIKHHEHAKKIGMALALGSWTSGESGLR